MTWNSLVAVAVVHTFCWVLLENLLQLFSDLYLIKPTSCPAGYSSATNGLVLVFVETWFRYFLFLRFCKQNRRTLFIMRRLLYCSVNLTNSRSIYAVFKWKILWTDFLFWTLFCNMSLTSLNAVNLFVEHFEVREWIVSWWVDNFTRGLTTVTFEDLFFL